MTLLYNTIQEILNDSGITIDDTPSSSADSLYLLTMRDVKEPMMKNMTLYTYIGLFNTCVSLYENETVDHTIAGINIANSYYDHRTHKQLILNINTLDFKEKFIDALYHKAIWGQDKITMFFSIMVCYKRSL